MNETKIEWTDRTWNPVTGCTKVSPGCDHCYAEGIARRFAGSKAFPNGFDVTLHPERLNAPLRWRKPARVFVNSMSDLFHDDVPDEFIAHVWAVMAATPQHTYQVLTKRHGRMRSLLSRYELRGWVEDLVSETAPAEHDIEFTWPLSNVWLGVSVEDQKRADLRIPALIDTPAAVRFLSCEPLLGEIDIDPWTCPSCDRRRWVDDQNWSPEHPGEWDGTRSMGDGRIPCGACNHGGWHEDDIDRPGIDWVIVGGESGPGARPMHPNWARQLRDQCVASEVPFFFKQHGEWLGTDERDPRYTGPVKGGWVKYDGTGWAAFTLPVPEAPAWVLRLGKKAAGRELDGRTWDEYPAVAA